MYNKEKGSDFVKVYKVTNIQTGAVYIGITTKSVRKRWQQHINSSRSDNLYFHRAIRKYGVANFKIEQIDEANTIDELKQKEQFYIKQYYCCVYDPQYEKGYNITFGGDGEYGLYGEAHPASKNSDEQRWLVIKLLKETNLHFKQIAEIAMLDSADGEKLVSMINCGENFHQEGMIYPIRQNTRSIAKHGANNPAAKVDAVKKVVELLITTDMSQKDIAIECGVHYNTVSDINRCVRWTELHNFKKNIRKERSRGGDANEYGDR